MQQKESTKPTKPPQSNDLPIDKGVKFKMRRHCTKRTPRHGERRDEIAPGLRAIPAGRKAVVAFTVDAEAGEVDVPAVTHAGADWISRSKALGRECTSRAFGDPFCVKRPVSEERMARPTPFEPKKPQWGLLDGFGV